MHRVGSAKVLSPDHLSISNMFLETVGSEQLLVLLILLIGLPLDRQVLRLLAVLLPLAVLRIRRTVR
jgi:hypothetical protein